MNVVNSPKGKKEFSEGGDLNWEGVISNPWFVGISGSLAAAGIIWLCTKLFGSKREGPPVMVQQSASPAMSQNFQPVINIHPTVAMPVKETASGQAGPGQRAQMNEHELVPEDGMLWRIADDKRLGPYCPTCFEADRKTISLVEGATRGTYSCPIHKTSFWTAELKKRFSGTTLITGSRRTARSTPAMSASARELLMEASKDRQGVVMKVQTLLGSSVQTNGRNFAEPGNPRSEAQWRGAVAELGKLRLLEDRAGEGEVFFVTDEGYGIAELLNQQHGSGK